MENITKRKIRQKPPIDFLPYFWHFYCQIWTGIQENNLKLLENIPIISKYWKILQSKKYGRICQLNFCRIFCPFIAKYGRDYRKIISKYWKNIPIISKYWKILQNKKYGKNRQLNFCRIFGAFSTKYRRKYRKIISNYWKNIPIISNIGKYYKIKNTAETAKWISVVFFALLLPNMDEITGK